MNDSNASPSETAYGMSDLESIVERSRRAEEDVRMRLHLELI